jgi:hypothetical protein
MHSGTNLLVLCVVCAGLGLRGPSTFDSASEACSQQSASLPPLSALESGWLQENLSPGQSTWINASLYKGPWTWRTSGLIISILCGIILCLSLDTEPAPIQGCFRILNSDYGQKGTGLSMDDCQHTCRLYGY